MKKYDYVTCGCGLCDGSVRDPDQPKSNDLFRSLSVLAGAIYRDQLALFTDSTPATPAEMLETYE
jgi:hypothetical protein